MADPSDITVPPPDPPDPPNINNSMNQSTSRSREEEEEDRTMEGTRTAEQVSSSSPNTSSSTTSTPPWIVWSRGLDALLDDSQGQDLFKAFLNEEGCHHQLAFLWACEGLKSIAVNDPPKIPDLIRRIYGRFVPNLIGLSESTRTDLAQAIVDGRFTEIEIFQTAESEVLTHMKEHLYPNFLKSEIYISACSGEDVGGGGSGHSSGRERRQSEERENEEEPISPPPGAVEFEVEEDSSSELLEEGKGRDHNPPLLEDSIDQPFLSTSSQLQTVHEDRELNMGTSASSASSLAASASTSHSKGRKYVPTSVPLTKELLLATVHERARATEIPSSGKILSLSAMESTSRIPKHSTSQVPFPYHASYSSYNPVSRVDSEVQSMSSGAMTDDDRSTANGGHRMRHHAHSSNDHRRQHGQGHSSVLTDPRSRGGPPTQQKCVHRGEQSGNGHSDRGERRRLPEIPRGHVALNPSDNIPTLGQGQVQDPNERIMRRFVPDPSTDPEAFAALITNKLNEYLQKFSGEDLLKQAIDKIRLEEEARGPQDILESHMAKIPHFADSTPTKSWSPNNRRSPTTRRKGHMIPPPVPPNRRRDRDMMVSTFSVDSGNVPDTESLMVQSSDTESQSRNPIAMPKSQSMPHEFRIPFDYPHPHIHRHPNNGNGNASRGQHQQHHPHPPNPKGFLGRINPGGLFKRLASTEFLDSGISTASGPSATYPPLPPPPYHGHGVRAAGPAGAEKRVQDWVTESSSSPSQSGFPSQRKPKKPNPPELEDMRKKLSQTLGFQFQSPDPHQVAQVPQHSPPSSDSSMDPNVVRTFVKYDDQKDTYVLKIRRIHGMEGSGVTLSALKERLPLKGDYRYFFKRECPDLGSSVVLEEFFDNAQELPMLEGKIFAHLKTLHPPSNPSGAPVQL